MSSNIEVQRICEVCNNPFTAKTTLTRYCSRKCNSRSYKQKIKNLKIELSNKETLSKINKPIEELKTKPFLSIAETSKLIGISRRTIYRLLQNGDLKAGKAGKRTIISRKKHRFTFRTKPMAIKVKLRQKAISGKRQSLYLDFYPAIIHPKTGLPTRREFLGLYLTDIKKNPMDKEYNQKTLDLANSIRQKKENELNKPEIYTEFEKGLLKDKVLGEKNFVEYFKQLADKRKTSNHDNWMSAYKYLNNLTKGNLKFSDLNETFCREFKEYLLTVKSNKSNKVTLSQNSAVSYYNKFKAALKEAYKDSLLKTDLNSKIDTIKQAETQRNFLTLEELNQLVKTECQNPLLKKAAIFSALTGLRFSDIQKMVWGEIEYIEGDGYFVRFKQQKTKGVENMPISDQAFNMLGQQQGPTDRVFEGLTYSAYSNKHLYQWIGAAGITKNITFHCFRHTFATLQLSLGTDIYTVSKMLGHRELKTTQIYAKNH